MSATSADLSQHPHQWEAEKNELVKARDEALAQAKVNLTSTGLLPLSLTRHAIGCC